MTNKWQWAALWKRAAKKYRRFDRYLYKSLLQTRIKHQDTRYWARVWKRAAKKQRHEADRYFIAWMKAVVQLSRRGRQARVWKRAAKDYRTMFKLCALTSVPLWKERYWASQRSARVWKAAARKWRRKAGEK